MARRWIRRTLPAISFAFLLSCSTAPTGPNDRAWRLLPGHVEKLSFPAFRDGRQCWVYLPPGYGNESRGYPVLYVNDGELVFDLKDGLHLNRICEDLIRAHEIQPLIVVAIANGPGQQRWMDYTPWRNPYYRSFATGGGDSYVRAIRDTLKPEIDRRYRTLRDAANTAMAGLSLGGLISGYAGLAYDDTFGKTAAFSPSYWYWGVQDSAVVDLYDLVGKRGRPPHLVRYYQDTGYPDDNDISYMTALLIQVGMELGKDLYSNTVVGGEHATGACEHRYPDALRFLFPPG